MISLALGLCTKSGCGNSSYRVTISARETACFEWLLDNQLLEQMQNK